jgi:methionyl-tRNA synthetase
VEHVEEENYFFRLSRFEQRLIDWYSSHPGAVVPEHRVNEVIGFIKQGLQDFSVSRKTLTWGIPLPFDESHVAYVWFDALANYITAIGYGSDDAKFNEWWPVNHHLIGKDIIRFHNVYWPAMLMSAGIEPPKGWAVGGWLLVGGEKMSKTSGNVVNPLDLVDEFGVDGFRYYVLSDTTYGNDGDFTYEGLVSRYNSDLANNLGNLAARVATVVGKKCGGVGTAPDPNSPLAEHARIAVAETIAQWDIVQPSRALEATWGLIRATNAHLENNEPWKAEAGPLVDTVMGDALEALRIVTLLAFPAIPDTAREIWRRIGMTTDIESCRIPADVQWGQYPVGSPVEKGDPLFPRRTLA